jgi:hypothetical protein
VDHNAAEETRITWKLGHFGGRGIRREEAEATGGTGQLVRSVTEVEMFTSKPREAKDIKSGLYQADR